MRKRRFRDLRPGDWLFGEGTTSGRESIIVLKTESGWNPGEVTLEYLWTNGITYRKVVTTLLGEESLWADWRVVSGRVTACPPPERD